jgi:hypothetical protein
VVDLLDEPLDERGLGIQRSEPVLLFDLEQRMQAPGRRAVDLVADLGALPGQPVQLPGPRGSSDLCSDRPGSPHRRHEHRVEQRLSLPKLGAGGPTSKLKAVVCGHDRRPRGLGWPEVRVRHSVAITVGCRYDLTGQLQGEVGIRRRWKLTMLMSKAAAPPCPSPKNRRPIARFVRTSLSTSSLQGGHTIRAGGLHGRAGP